MKTWKQFLENRGMQISNFLQEIRSGKDTKNSILIFADWLEESGDPLGEQIRNLALSRYYVKKSIIVFVGGHVGWTSPRSLELITDFGGIIDGLIKLPSWLYGNEWDGGSPKTFFGQQEVSDPLIPRPTRKTLWCNKRFNDNELQILGMLSGTRHE